VHFFCDASYIGAFFLVFYALKDYYINSEDAPRNVSKDNRFFLVIRSIEGVGRANVTIRATFQRTGHLKGNVSDTTHVHSTAFSSSFLRLLGNFLLAFARQFHLLAGALEAGARTNNYLARMPIGPCFRACDVEHELITSGGIQNRLHFTITRKNNQQ
jgi:hypothetical protein